MSSTQTPMKGVGNRSNNICGTDTSRRRAPLDGKLADVDKLVSRLCAEKAPLDLTFGIEIELLLLGDIDTTYTGDSPIDQHYPAKMLVYKALTKPITAPCAECGEMHTFQLPLAKPGKSRRFRVDAWSIVTDCTVQLTREEMQLIVEEECPDIDQTGLELVSRVFTKGKNLMTTDGSMHRHSITVDQEITQMLKQLNDAFNTVKGTRGPRANNRIVVNSSCGFHVHVGNGIKSIGFPLSTVKDLFALYVANERAIDSVQHVERIDGTTLAVTPLQDDAYWRPSFPGFGAFNCPNSTFFIRMAFRLLQAQYYNHEELLYDTSPGYPESHFDIDHIARSARSFQPCDWISLINGATSIADLRSIHQYNEYEHHNTLNFEHLDEFGLDLKDNGKVTIEFRQAASTLEPVEILSWVDVVTSMVQFAHTSSPADMRRHLDEVLTDPDFDLLRLLETLGCQPSTFGHYKHVLGLQETGGDYSDTRWQKQTDETIELEDDTLVIRVEIIKSRADALKPERVREKVSTKLKMGGYGRFERAYLDKYEPPLSTEEKQLLTGGTVVARRPTARKILGQGDEEVEDTNTDDDGDSNSELSSDTDKTETETVEEETENDKEKENDEMEIDTENKEADTDLNDPIDDPQTLHQTGSNGSSEHERRNGETLQQSQCLGGPLTPPKPTLRPSASEHLTPDEPFGMLPPPLIPLPVGAGPGSLMSRRNRFVSSLNTVRFAAMPGRMNGGGEAGNVSLQSQS